MEERLIPLNAVLDLATPNGTSRAVFAGAGYEVAGLEVPCVTRVGTVVIDVVLAHPTTGHLIACEAKSGANVEEDQARRYRALEARTVVSGAFVTLRERVEPTLDVLYIALAASADRIALGLNQAGASFAVLAIHPDKLVLESSICASIKVKNLFSTPIPRVAPPSRHIPFDHDSSLDEIQPYVAAALVANLARRVPMVSTRALAEQAAPPTTHCTELRLRDGCGDL